jgi:hypothetical protein
MGLKKIIVAGCPTCPYCFWETKLFVSACTLSKKVIKDIGSQGDVPKWCPLADEVEDSVEIPQPCLCEVRCVKHDGILHRYTGTLVINRACPFHGNMR